MLPKYFDYIFVHLRQKAHLRPELSPKFCQLKARTQKARPNEQLCRIRAITWAFFRRYLKGHSGRTFFRRFSLKTF